VISNRILVVDDDELVSEYLAALLVSENYDVTVLNQPAKALQHFLKNPDDFDLIITDQVMPKSFGLSGFFSKPINEDLLLSQISQLVSCSP